MTTRARREARRRAATVAAVESLSPARAGRHNLIAVSDLHLGSDLRDGVDVAALREKRGFDVELAAMLDHYRESRRGGLPWKLVLNGDVFDLVAVTLRPAPGEQLAFTLTKEDLSYGLGAEEAKTIWKLRRILERHELLVRALARFIDAGNALVVVRGNHDAELAFAGAQTALKEGLADRAHPLPGEGRDAFLARIAIHRWFYLEPGGIWFEHGHVYDEWSTTEDLPWSDGRGGLKLAISSQVIRYFSNVVEGGAELVDGTDGWGVVDYLRFGLRVGNPLAVVGLYLAMLWRLLKGPLAQSLLLSRRAVATAGARLFERVDPGAAHFQLLRAHLARLLGKEADHQALELLRLLKSPAGRRLPDVLRLFYLDQLGLLGIVGLAAVVAGHEGRTLGARVFDWGAIGLGFVTTSLALASMRRTASHPKLRDAARRVAEVMRVRTVVMGHSHHAVDEPLPSGARYVNLGSWTNQLAATDAEGFPHLLVVRGEARLCRWGASQPAVEAEGAAELLTA